MSEQSIPTQNTGIPPASPSSTVILQSDMEQQNRSVQILIALVALAMLGCFFLPWITLLGSLSGFDLQKLPSTEAELVWCIPAGAALALLAVAAKTGVGAASQLAGAIPFLALIYYRTKLGDRFFQSLQYGAHLTLFFGAVLFVLPRFLKKKQP